MAVTGSPLGSRSGSVYDYLNINLIGFTSTTLTLELSTLADFESKFCFVWNGQNIKYADTLIFTIDVTSTPTIFTFDLTQGYDNDINYVGGGSINAQYNSYGFWDNGDWDQLYRDDITQIELLEAGFILDEFTLSDEAVGYKEVERSVEDTLTLSDILFKEVQENISDSLIFNDILLKEIQKSVSDSLVLEETTAKEQDITLSISDTLSLSETITRIKESEQSVNDSLVFAENVEIEISQNVTDTISLIETVLAYKIKFKAVSDTLSLSEVVNMTITEPDSQDALTFGDEADFESGKGQSESLSLTETVSRGGSEFTRSVNDSLAFSDYSNQYNQRSCNESYTPDVAFGIANDLSFAYPSTGSPSITATIRCPEFGNTFNLQKNNIVRKSRGGVIKIARPSTWIDNKFQKLQSIALSENQAEEFTTFLTTTAGKTVKMTDWNNRVWIGRIVTPENEILQGIGDCQYKASFTFEGALN